MFSFSRRTLMKTVAAAFLPWKNLIQNQIGGAYWIGPGDWKEYDFSDTRVELKPDEKVKWKNYTATFSIKKSDMDDVAEIFSKRRKEVLDDIGKEMDEHLWNPPKELPSSPPIEER